MGYTVLSVHVYYTISCMYTISPTQVHRHTVDMCGSYSSCDTCTSSPDPVCGWCVLHGHCTRQSLCPPVQDKNGVQQTVWLQVSGECPVITMATPPVIYLEDITVSSLMWNIRSGLFSLTSVDPISTIFRLSAKRPSN